MQKLVTRNWDNYQNPHIECLVATFEDELGGHEIYIDLYEDGTIMLIDFVLFWKSWLWTVDQKIRVGTYEGKVLK